jgi:tetratricopeptide (TPR) repeat protein
MGTSANGDRRRRILNWEMTALIAGLVILASPFLYLARHDAVSPIAAEVDSGFVGREKCQKCHQVSYAKWQGSHHDLAMDEATEVTVLGDFSDAVFTDPYNNITSRFYKRNGDFFVETEGPDGQLGEFLITHTFGVYPLQQYLVPFPGGRLQCLNIAWDIEREVWYRLPPYEVEGTDDWLHWTRGGQTWNGMCAECHSTRLTKGYDSEADSYKTAWVEIDVGCEACHGPGLKHILWADRPPFARSKIENYGLTVQTGDLDSEQQVTLCAPCHSRRFQLGDNMHDQGKLLDKIVPSLLEEGLYYPDGQILEEVYVYGSFTQSKMYGHGVRCSDCHDPHSLQLHKEKNDLCLQCHRAEIYDTESHHFHKRVHEGKPSEGFLCVKCHMPGRDYMGIDYRPDHSLRIPRPDLSKELGTPNSCSAKGCHDNKSLDWNVDSYTKWYGQSRKPHYGTTIAAGRAREPEAAAELIRLAGDSLLPAIVRATALSLLRRYPGDESLAGFKRALEDEDALLRYTAIRNMEQMDQDTRLKLMAPKLYDPVRAVRMEAALQLSPVPRELIREDDQAAFDQSLEEYRKAMLYNSDFAAQRFNLGNLAQNQSNGDKAAEYYLKAIEIDDQFFPAKVNLAMHYNRNQKNDEAKRLLHEVLEQQPELYEVAYSLGLLYAEMNNYSEAAVYLGKAADGMPHYSRVRFNQALALLKLKKWQEGEKALTLALQEEPSNSDYFVTLARLYLDFGRTEQARGLAERVLQQAPDHPQALELMNMLKMNPQ